jgi:hypothetical protein
MEHFIARHFFSFRADKSRTGVSSCTLNAVSALVRRPVPLGLESFTVPYQVVHCFIVLHTYTIHTARLTIRNLLKCDQAAQWPDTILDTVETNFLSSFWPSNQGRRKTFGCMEWVKLPVSAASHFPCNSFSKKDLAKPWKSIAKVAYQKQHYSILHVVPVCPQSRYPRAPREKGSILFQPQLHHPISRYTFVFIRKPSDESKAILSWTTEP